jgi:hypothetical protein
MEGSEMAPEGMSIEHICIVPSYFMMKLWYMAGERLKQMKSYNQNVLYETAGKNGRDR